MHDRWDERRGRGRERGASAEARRARVIALLERVARGLPIAVGTLIIGLPASSCTHCYDFPAAPTSHPRSAVTDLFVGPPERFDPARCSALCRALDGLDPLDASALVRDAGGPSRGPMAQYGGRLDATCGYSPDGSTLHCSYREHFCETNASCEPTIYGRTPSGLVARRSLASSALARWLADGAHLEAASVPAFEDLVAELDAFGAPEALVHAARAAADDERAHARSLGRLAHRLGARVSPVVRTETGLRDPESVAIDDAIEGCAREAYGALGAAFQAQHARSHAVRHAYRAIAADEARHALLSFRANDWLSARLSSAARRRVEEARAQSVAALAASLAQETDATLRDVLGLPDATRGIELLSALA